MDNNLHRTEITCSNLLMLAYSTVGSSLNQVKLFTQIFFLGFRYTTLQLDSLKPGSALGEKGKKIDVGK